MAKDRCIERRCQPWSTPRCPISRIIRPSNELVALGLGARLGPYEIVSLVGAGGMGEVYRARDTRLDRTVAIKILPQALAADPQFRERFDREARTISQLTHPHICTLYDVGQQDGVAFLVMEHLEGETLADRLTRGALPLDDALEIAIEIADALTTAHRHGIVHRDLKPGNVMLTKGGAKLLDFGLAKAAGGAGAAAGLSMLPTTPPGLTAQGTILGTFQYMAPEQLEGHEADARTDIFAFGTIVYEMITGKKAFEGKSQASLIAAILDREPPSMATMQPLTPRSLDRMIKICLAKEPDDRWQTARDLLRELKSVSDSSRPSAQPAGVAQARRRTWIMASALTGLLVAVSVPALLYFRSPAPLARSIRFEIPAAGSPFLMAISPDGRQLAYVAPATGSSGANVLWIRPLNSLDARMLAGTEGAQAPDWSPDGRFIVFGGPDGKLKTVDVAGGRPQTLTEINSGSYRRSTWSRDGVIIFASAPVLRRVSASGGAAADVSELDRSLGELLHSTPWFLPDGHHFLYTAWSSNPEHRALYVGSLESKARTRLMTVEGKAVYVPSGFVLFLRDRTLMARPFNADLLQFAGDAVPLAEEVAYNPQLGQSAFDVSEEGTLIFRRGGPQATATRQWIWMDRTGKSTGPIGAPHDATQVTLAPDGKRVAFSTGFTGSDIWIDDFDRDLRTRLTADPAVDVFPVWAPDGARLVFASNRGNSGLAMSLYEKPSDGAVPERLLVKAEPGQIVLPFDWSRDGRLILAQKLDQGQTSRSELWVLPLSGDQKPFPYLATPFWEGQPALSPNGRWLAYVSNESGSSQVIVQPFPNPSGGKWQISTKGGQFPRWKRDGRELYYLNPASQIVAVSVSAGDQFDVGKSTPLFPTPLAYPAGASASILYDVTADGQRFLLSAPVGPTPAATGNSAPITVVVNWQAALGARERR